MDNYNGICKEGRREGMRAEARKEGGKAGRKAGEQGKRGWKPYFISFCSWVEFHSTVLLGANIPF